MECISWINQNCVQTEKKIKDEIYDQWNIWSFNY